MTDCLGKIVCVSPSAVEGIFTYANFGQRKIKKGIPIGTPFSIAIFPTFYIDISQSLFGLIGYFKIADFW